MNKGGASQISNKELVQIKPRKLINSYYSNKTEGDIDLKKD